MKRREMLGVGAATLLAGCSSAADENRNEAYAEQTANAVDDEPSVNLDNWAINDGTLYLHFTPVGSNKRAVQTVAGAYAGNVANGLDLSLTGNGYEGEETILYFEIEVDWAQQFMDDEITEDEYLSLIAETSP